jgi:Protein of unknown function (DUF3592)
MDSANPHVAQIAASREKILRYMFILQFVAAIPFLWFGYYTGKVHAHLLLKRTTTTGTVVAVVPVQFSRGSSSSSFASSQTSYEAVVAFTARDRQFRFQEWKGTSSAPSVGTQLPVIYDPADPVTSMVDRGYWNLLPWAPCAASGLFLSLVALKGFLALVLARPRPASAARN